MKKKTLIKIFNTLGFMFLLLGILYDSNKPIMHIGKYILLGISIILFFINIILQATRCSKN